MSLFQIIDPSLKCPLIYQNNKIINISQCNDFEYTWKYFPILKNNSNIQYANIYCDGKSFEQLCPSNLKDDWDFYKSKYRANLVAIKEAKIDLTKNCLYDLIPEDILLGFNDLKNQICQKVFDTYKKPESYDILVGIIKVIEEIKTKNLKFNEELRKQYKLDNKSSKIAYNALGGATGRLKTFKGSFPIANLKKEFRDVLIPNNDVFIELDFNSAELRTMISLLDLPQPEYDLHEWNRKNIFDNKISREESKKEFFSFFYDDKKENEKLSQLYRKQYILDKFYNGEKIKTLFGKEIQCDLHHAINYVCQSTFSYLFFEQVVKVAKLLENKKSHISFLLHDSIIIDFDKEEKEIIPIIYKEFQNTRLGNFLASLKIGNNFKDIKKIEIKF